MKRFGLMLAAMSLIVTAIAPMATAAPRDHDDERTVAAQSDDPTKIHVLGVWAHPDDDTSIIGPCGVWRERYGIRCGIIMHTRGEGGGNSVGDESGPDLGLRRENEDRASHFRSGTVDIFNLDRVDFFYNTSAPLTQYFWDHDETLARVVRIIRQTRPDVIVGFSPLGSGHGNHQYAGRMIWEAIKAAADPTKFPEQLRGPNALKPWLVKKTTSGGLTAGTGGTAGPNCTVRFTPAPNNPYTVHGVWLGYESPYTWPAGNVQGMPAGTHKTWSQVAAEGARAHPTQARLMYQDVASPSCSRFAVTQSFVPFQPNTSEAGGRDEALFYGASIPDPGGMPLGSLFYLTFDRFFNVAGQPFQVTVHARSGKGTLPAGSVELSVPDGWSVSRAQPIGPIRDSGETTATFTVTPSASAAAGRYKIAANLTAGSVTAYTDNVVEIVPAVEGRFKRWGNFAEYDEWAAANTFVAGRSAAVAEIGAGETISLPVVVHNWSDQTQNGTVTLDVPEGYEVDTTAKSYEGLAAGAETTVTFRLTHTDPDAAAGRTETVRITTTYDAPAGSAAEDLTLTLVPTAVIGETPAAPKVDGVEGDGEYPGPTLDISRRWEGQQCNPNGVDCGEGSYAKVTWHGDDLYVFAHVVDDVQSAAAPPERCFGHWLVDSVEILLDPRGDSLDTSSTFKLGVFPFTDDPTGSAGNGVNGPCWTRDADNHQGFSSGPLADTVKGGPNAPGVEVATNAVLNPSRTYEDGSYNIEVKIPLAVLPAAVGPTSPAPRGDADTNAENPRVFGLNITPYDSDTQNFVGKTRLAWSPFGSQQSEPYRWGHVYLDGYEPPADRPTTPKTPIIPDSALQGVDSPQTIYQSATNGVPISGRAPSKAVRIGKVELGKSAVTLDLESSEEGTARVFLWSGPHGYIPVFTSSCPDDYDGFTACAPTDGSPPPWGTDMGGRVIDKATTDVEVGRQKVTVPVDQAAYRTLRANGSVLVSFEARSGGVQAWYFPVADSFGPPLKNAPAVTTVNAGSTVPVKLADGGLADLADGSPTLTPMVCGLGAATAGAKPTTGTLNGRSGVYMWKTAKELKGTCGRLDVRLRDGTVHQALIQFR
ncbi:MAG TPA: PxKF domain-containing protein [Actinopolymorphaceae bacterium]